MTTHKSKCECFCHGMKRERGTVLAECPHYHPINRESWETVFDNIPKPDHLSEIDNFCIAIKSFMRQTILSEREALRTELCEQVEGMKLLEVSSDPITLMWKQRMNRNIDQVLSLIKN